MSKTTVPAGLLSGKAAASLTATINLPADGVIVRTEPRFISRLNVEAAYGRSWRWLLDLLPELRAAGVPIVGSRKAPMVRAEDLDAFLRTRAAAEATSPALAPANDLDEVDALLAKGGTVRTAGRSRG